MILFSVLTHYCRLGQTDGQTFRRRLRARFAMRRVVKTKDLFPECGVVGRRPRVVVYSVDVNVQTE